MATEFNVDVEIPFNFEIIVQDADSTIDNSSTDELYDQLYSGVFLNGKRKASHLMNCYTQLTIITVWC